MPSTRESRRESIRLVLSRAEAPIADIAREVGRSWNQVERDLTTMRYAGEVRRGAPGTVPGKKGKHAGAWRLGADPSAAREMGEARGIATKICDRHGRAAREEIATALRRRFPVDETNAAIEQMTAEGTLDVVGGLLGRPDRTDSRTTFGQAIETLRGLGRPFPRSEALRLLPHLSITHLDTIILRGIELGFLAKEGDCVRGVKRTVLRQPTTEDVLAAFPADRATSLADLRGRLSGFNTRRVGLQVESLMRAGKVVKTGRGAYALAGGRAKVGEISTYGRIVEFLRDRPGLWTGPQIASGLGRTSRGEVQEIRYALSRLHKRGVLRRPSTGQYAFPKRRLKAKPEVREPVQRALRRGTKTSSAAAAKTIRHLILAEGGVVAVSTVGHAAGLHGASLQAGIERLVAQGRAVVVDRHLISLDPPARLDRRTTPPRLRMLAAAIAYGSVEKAKVAMALGGIYYLAQTAKSLVKNGLLVAGPEGHVPAELPHLAPLRRLVKTTGAGALSSLERLVFEHVRRHPAARKAEIARAIGFGRGAVNRATDSAVRKGALTAHGPNGEFHEIHPDAAHIGARGGKPLAPGAASARREAERRVSSLQ